MRDAEQSMRSKLFPLFISHINAHRAHTIEE